MTDCPAPTIPKWPFLLGDALLLGLAGFLVWQGHRPMLGWEVGSLAGCVALGGILAVIPFILQYQAALRLAEAGSLTTTVSQIQNLETVARQVGSATTSWQNIQDLSAKTVESARQVGEVVTGTAKSFAEFIQKANDAEKNHLRLEVEKLRRAEQDWLQVAVRMLDHVYAVYQAAVRSRRANLIDQLGSFQNACRDTVRRVGLVPFVAVRGEAFDPKLHQLADSTSMPDKDSKILETVATGISFQGQMIRPALVTLEPAESTTTGAPGTEPLPSDSTGDRSSETPSLFPEPPGPQA